MSHLQSFLARQAQSVRSRARMIRSARARTKNVELSEKLTKFYATNLVSDWQRKDVKAIRDAYEIKQKDLAVAHDIAASRLADTYMRFEYDYLLASNDFKIKNPGMEWHDRGVMGIFSGAFWRNIGRRAGMLGIKGFQYGEVTKE